LGPGHNKLRLFAFFLGRGAQAPRGDFIRLLTVELSLKKAKEKTGLPGLPIKGIGENS